MRVMGEGSHGGKSKPSSKLNYRSDVDGLRAVAVLLVIGGHFRTHLSGGYIGVDVFFVISGYLISAAILKEMANGTFSIVSFYERRIRRIFPALIVMLLGTCALAYHYLFPTEMVDFGRSLLAAMLSVSNFFFWHEAGYFDAPSAYKPLLHTWSLAVEEQFYIFFPIFLVLIRKTAPHRLKAAIFAVTGITFALAVYYTHSNASEAFFFAPLRAWELLLGTIVSQRYLPSIRTAIGRNVASAVGILLIIAAGFFYTPQTSFPGFSALAPCIGAALIIAAGETGQSVVGSLLSLRPVVWVGLISYSLYLWHWPVLVFQNVGAMVAPLPEDDRRLKLAMLAISMLLGYLSWRFVETPFRKGRLRPNTRSLFIINGLGFAAILAIGFAAIATHGVPQRFPTDALQVAKYLNYDKAGPFRQGTCFLGSDDSFSNFQQATCLANDPNRKNILILGDSQAAQAWFGMNQVFPEVHFLQATGSACPIWVHTPTEAPASCRQLAKFMHQTYLPAAHLNGVLLGGRWGKDHLTDLDEQIRFLQHLGLEIYLVGPMVEWDQPEPRLLGIALRDRTPESVAKHLFAWPSELDNNLRVLARDKWHVHYISYFENLCTPSCVEYAAPGVPLVFDGHHMTAEGSVLFARNVRTRGGLPILQ